MPKPIPFRIRISRQRNIVGCFLDCAMSASDRLIIPFSADGSSKRSVRAVLALLYGITRIKGAERSEFFLNSQRFRMSSPKIYSYVGNRLTQIHRASAKAFESVVNEIGKEIFAIWQQNQNLFSRMFQAEISDANSASVVSGGLGIPISALAAGTLLDRM
jgi:chromosome partitioning protein